MSKRQLIILFGALIILLTLISGLPSILSKIIYIILGALIITVAYTTTKPSQNSQKKIENAPYVDAHASPAPTVSESDQVTPPSHG
ncbi:MAG TPA: hypothetical protein VL335_00535 [Candidatus Paceibacterota bacterium]|jgi:flagellar biosynthesis component FlhA|nr:hypothetical protein [Candidatus Paceibacterota bacterium]